jgi:manganese-transporting P-type ATPase
MFLLTFLILLQVRVSNKISDNEYYILTKGAPEVMATLYEQVPQGYDSEQHQYTSKGRRVLSLGYKHLKHLKNIHQLEKIDRSSLESNLICCGFLVLDSPLKPQSKPAITQLIRSSHRVVIITGDNPLTACSVASQVHVLSKPRRLQLILKEDLIWYPVDSNITNTIPFDGGSDEHHCSKHFKSLITNSYELCVTGGALIALANKYGDQINNINFDHQVPPSYIMKSLVINVLVFARTAPVQKERILTTLKTNGYTTLMCGDGTNDVGALKQADVGISIINSIEMDQMAEKVSNAAKYNNKNKKNKSNFNEQQLNQLLREMEMESKEQNIQLGDASVASGFTSKTASIACALDVIRQGRCTLVTTLQMYKILAVNCLVTAYNLSALYLYGVKQGDSQMTFVGLAVAGFFFFVSRSKPLMTLAPKRPPSRVFSRFVLLSVFGQSIVHFAVSFYK